MQALPIAFSVTSSNFEISPLHVLTDISLIFSSPLGTMNAPDTSAKSRAVQNQNEKMVQNSVPIANRINSDRLGRHAFFLDMQVGHTISRLTIVDSSNKNMLTKI